MKNPPLAHTLTFALTREQFHLMTRDNKVMCITFAIIILTHSSESVV